MVNFLSSLFFSPTARRTTVKQSQHQNIPIADTSLLAMARGNQRDKAREKTQKDQAAQVSPNTVSARLSLWACHGRKSLIGTKLMTIVYRRKRRTLYGHLPPKSSKSPWPLRSHRESPTRGSNNFSWAIAIGHRV